MYFGNIAAVLPQYIARSSVFWCNRISIKVVFQLFVYESAGVLEYVYMSVPDTGRLIRHERSDRMQEGWIRYETSDSDESKYMCRAGL